MRFNFIFLLTVCAWEFATKFRFCNLGVFWIFFGLESDLIWSGSSTDWLTSWSKWVHANFGILSKYRIFSSSSSMLAWIITFIWSLNFAAESAWESFLKATSKIWPLTFSADDFLRFFKSNSSSSSKDVKTSEFSLNWTRFWLRRLLVGREDSSDVA